MMESVLVRHEQASSQKQQSVSDTHRSALIPGLMELSIVAPEPVVQSAEAVQQAALASDTTGPTPGKSHQTTQPEMKLLSTLEEDGGEGVREGCQRRGKK